ncbi:unnamed protein product [Rotaria sp. Silwood1]|nr:unnamed protein product [Rotaria sp. Silwood1]
MNLFFNTSILPTDILSFCDEDFYKVVEKFAGSAEAKLLEAQGIRSVYSFLNTEDVFAILSISCPVLNDIKRLVCFEADDRTYTVKPGCRGSIRYLYQLLYQKHEEHLKEHTLKSKRIKPPPLVDNNHVLQDIFQDFSETDLSSSVPQQYSTQAGSTYNFNHHKLIVYKLNEWFGRNRQVMNLEGCELIENEDFRLFIVSNGPNKNASISCSCGTKVQLTKLHQGFSLSNYYKHIKSKSCLMITKKKKIIADFNGESTTTGENQSLDDETSQDISMTEIAHISDSSIIIADTVNNDKSLKRSSDTQSKPLSKKQRIRN